MAIKTQMRLPQITGSFGTNAGRINENITAAEKNDINATDLSVILSHMAAGIKRIHGKADFSNAAAGTFHQNLVPDADGTRDFGSSTLDWNNIYAATGSFSSNVTIEGNLTVNGTTTTIDTVNTTIQDTLIALNSGSDGFGTSNNDVGILFSSPTVGGQSSALFIDESDPNDVFVFSKTWTSASATQISYATSDLATVRLGKLEVEDAGDSISIDSSNLLIAAAAKGILSGSTGVDIGVDNGSDVAIQIGGSDHIVISAENSDGQIRVEGTAALILSGTNGTVLGGDNGAQVDIQLAGSSIGTINQTSGNFTLSGSDGTAILLDSPLGSFTFARDLANNNARGIQALVGAGEFNFVNVDAIDANNAGFKFALSNNFQEQRLEMSGAVRFLEDSNGGNFVNLRAQDSIDNNFQLLLPNVQGSAGEVLKIDSVATVDGLSTATLAFAAAGGAANSSKNAFTVTASMNAGNVLSNDANGGTKFDVSAVSSANAANAIDVYLNGQLLVSSSDAYVGYNASSTGDYVMDHTSMSTADFKFSFGLENDDIVQIIVRA